MSQGSNFASAGGGIFSFLMSTDAAFYGARLAKAKTHLQEAKNKQAATAASHQTVMQSLGNQRRVEAAGARFNVMRENLSRSVDSMTASTSMGILRSSEQMGAITAQAAAAGMGGSSVELYNETVRTGAAQRLAMSERDKRAAVRNASDNAAAIMGDAYGGMDTTFIAANIDRSDQGSTSYDLWGDLATLGVVAAATAAGAPQVGSAIAEARAAGNYAEAGNAQAASSSLTSAMGSLKKSGDEWGTLASYFKL